MIIIALASFGIFVERELWVKRLRIVFSNIAILMPFGFLYFSTNFWFVSFLVAFYIVFYFN